MNKRIMLGIVSLLVLLVSIQGVSAGCGYNPHWFCKMVSKCKGIPAPMYIDNSSHTHTTEYIGGGGSGWEKKISRWLVGDESISSMLGLDWLKSIFMTKVEAENREMDIMMALDQCDGCTGDELARQTLFVRAVRTNESATGYGMTCYLTPIKTCMETTA